MQCQRCQKNVYAMELLVFNQMHFHKWCFRCKKCNSTLSIAKTTVEEGEVYCSRHYWLMNQRATDTRRTNTLDGLPPEIDLNEEEFNGKARVGRTKSLQNSSDRDKRASDQHIRDSTESTVTKEKEDNDAPQVKKTNEKTENSREDNEETSVMDNLLKQHMALREQQEKDHAQHERELLSLQTALVQMEENYLLQIAELEKERDNFEQMYLESIKENKTSPDVSVNASPKTPVLRYSSTKKYTDSITIPRQSYDTLAKRNSLALDLLTPAVPSLIKEEDGWTICQQTSHIPNVSYISFLNAKQSFYKAHFYNMEHTNYFAIDKNLGRTLISVKKENAKSKINSVKVEKGSQYRCVIRCEENDDEVITIPESWVKDGISTKRRNITRPNISVKDVINFSFPKLELLTKMKAVSVDQLEDLQESMLQFDEEHMISHYKFGVLYAKNGQISETEMFGNEHGSEGFHDFLDILGETIDLEGFDFFRGGLDVNTGTTGEKSVFTVWQNYEIMFHVSTFLPYCDYNDQQLSRKAHIGNDIVVIIYQDDPLTQFHCSSLVAQFPHVFIVVSPVESTSEDDSKENRKYRVTLAKRDGVPDFKPMDWGEFGRNGQFRDFLLTTLINGEHSSFKAPKFKKMRQRTRKLLLQSLFDTYTPDLKEEK